MKKKQNHKKKRLTALSIEFNDSHINPESGEIGFNLHFDAINNEHKVTLSHNNQIITSNKQIQGYFGENKFRVLSEIPKAPHDHSIDLFKKLNRYDRLLAIDTNSKIIQGINYSMGFSIQIVKKTDKDQIKWAFYPVQTFVIIGQKGKAENRNWMNLIKYIKSHNNHNPNFLIGIIVDSDLGEIDNFNKQSKPLIDDFYLPENFELIFASDRSSDNVLNKAIKFCHKLAKAIIDEFEKELIYFKHEK